MNCSLDRLTKSQVQIQKAAREFAKGEFDKNQALDMDEQCLVPERLLNAAAELGFLGIHFDSHYNGGGMGMFENVLIAEGLSRVDSSIGSALMLSVSGAEALLRFGSEKFKEKYLPILADGKIRASAAFAEAGGKDYPAWDSTTAEKDGDAFVINGKKTFVMNCGVADFYCVLCRMSNDKADDKKFSIFLIEADRKGVCPEEPDKTMGLRMTPFSDLRLDNVRVPETHLIGREGRGMTHASACMDETCILISAIALGTAQGVMDRALDYVRQRVQFGRKLTRFEVTRHKIADMATKVESARLFTYQAVAGFDSKQTDTKLIAMAKMVSTRAAVEVADEAIQLLGGYGYMKEYEVERFYRDAKTLELLMGPASVQKNVISGKVIGRM